MKIFIVCHDQIPLKWHILPPLQGQSLKAFQKHNSLFIAQPQFIDLIDNQWFEQQFWLNQGRLLGAKSGRGSAWIIKSEHGKWVLRHYYRGGLPAKINKDRFLWLGLDNCRAFKEFRLLQTLQQKQLPAPAPVAARVQRKGLSYRTDIIVEHINHQQTFADLLKPNPTQPLDLKQWQLIGNTIAQFHRQGVFHADLNAHNILLDQKQCFLIDFDKGSIKTINHSWQQANLNRLKRSIEKISKQSCNKHLKTAWQALQQAWQQNR